MRIGRSEYERILRHGEEAYPEEACGFLLASADGDVVEAVAVTNAAEKMRAERPGEFTRSAADGYVMEPREQLAVERAADAAGRTVIGVYHTKAGFLKSLDGRGPDTPRMVLPMMTAWRRLDVWRRGMMVMVKPAATVSRDDAMDAVTATLRGMRGLRPSQPNTFFLVGQDKMLETFNQLFGAIFMVGLGLSAVGLLVGGVGVVAIMMISVTERTREIGVRKALGATRGIILWQFLVEAATLTTLGALIGLVLGGMLAWVIRANSTIPASIPLGAIVASLVGAALTGIAFGMLPATRASKLDPVEALRHE